jgi:D-beta-D-heptose 7-phosphate kinase/D-beta-D-heptose 1-phosphate adenosyltransferase
VVDSRCLSAYRAVNVTSVKPNMEEALGLLGLKEDSTPDLIARMADRLLDLTGARIAAVTLDSKGALFLQKGEKPYRTYATPAGETKAIGAGDTFTAALALCLALNAPTSTAAEVASAAAAVVVEKEGTTTCKADELKEYLLPGGKCLGGLGRLAERVDAYRRRGLRVVFTNGCFDILHRGHISYLNQAKAMGDVLIVGINSDSSVRRLKGPGRPVNNLEDRIRVLAALSCVDHIIAFDEDTPTEVIRVVRPDIFTKGGDYTLATLPEASLVSGLGGQVHILPYIENVSTTGIIHRLKKTPELADALQTGGKG